MGFAQRIDYPAGTTTLGAGYTSGSGVVTLAITAASFLGGVTPTATNPVRFTLSSASNPATCCHYSCTGSSGSTLTGVTVLKGTDQNFLLGDNVFSSIYAEDFADIQNAGYLTAPVANASLANSSITVSGHAVALGGSVSLAAADVGLGSVTNAAQTLASVVPNTAPAAGQVLVGNAGGTAYAPVAMSGDATLATTGAITVTKTNGTAFAASAKIDTTNAANITSGTLPAARLPAPSATTLGGVQSVAAVSHQWINSISTAGVPSLSQPAFADLSGTATAAQLPAMAASGASHAAGIVPDPGAVAGSTKFLREDATWAVPAGGGSGTVTSVGLSLPATFTVTGSPVTTSGTLTATYAQQNANIVFAGPSSGGPLAPTFRALVPADYPVFVASGASHAAGAVPDPGAVAGTTKFLREDATWAVPAGGSATPGGTSGQVQYNNAGAFGGAANLTIGSGGQLHFGSIATPGTPADGDEWNDATQGCRAYRNGGLTAFRSHAIYLQTTNPAAITAAGNSTIIGSGIGTVSLPAGYLNTLGRILRIHARLYGSTAAASPGTFNMSLLLGGNVVATGGGTNMGTGRTNDVVQFDVLLAVRSTGSAGTIDVTGTFHGSYNGTACILSNPINAVLNGTAVGTQTVGTPVVVNLTAALALDIQLTLGSTVAGNTFTPTHVLVEVLA